MYQQIWLFFHYSPKTLARPRNEVYSFFFFALSLTAPVGPEVPQTISVLFPFRMPVQMSTVQLSFSSATFHFDRGRIRFQLGLFLIHYFRPPMRVRNIPHYWFLSVVIYSVFHTSLHSSFFHSFLVLNGTPIFPIPLFRILSVIFKHVSHVQATINLRQLV